MKRLTARPRLKSWPYPHVELGVYQDAKRVSHVTVTTNQQTGSHTCVLPDGRALIIKRAPTLAALVAALRRLL